MIKACIFDMYETLVSLFVGRVYFSEDFVKDINNPSKDALSFGPVCPELATSMMEWDCFVPF